MKQHLTNMRNVLLGLAVLLLAACGSTGETRPAPKEAAEAKPAYRMAVEQRAQARWDALIARDIATAWQFFTPGYRQLNDESAYGSDVLNRPTQWLQAEAERSECDGEDTCTVVVRVRVQAFMPGGGGRPMEVDTWVRESWLKLDGVWYHLPTR